LFSDDQSAIDRSFRFLIISRATRSASIIFVNLSLSLYLRDLGLSLVMIGVAYFFIVLFNVLVSIAFGMLGDRIGYARTMIVAELLPASSFFVLALSTNVYAIVLAAMVGGITGSPGGMRGAFSPGMTSYIARNWSNELERISRLSKVYSVSSLSAIAGSAMLMFHGRLAVLYGQIGADRVLYLISALMACASLVSLLFLKEKRGPRKAARIMTRESLGYSLRIIAPNMLNGAAVGISFPMLPLWFELAYRVSSGIIGAVFTSAYLFSSLGSFISGRIIISGKLRAITLSSGARLIQGALLIAMALSPFFLLAAAIYSLRSFIAGAGMPARSAVSIRGISEEDYGTASAVQGTFSRSSQLTSGLSGYLMSQWVDLPLIAGGLIQIAAALMFFELIRSWERSHGY